MDSLYIVASVALVAVGITWLRVWPAAFADLLWMLPMRPAAVGGSCLGVVIGLLAFMEWVFVANELTAVRFLLLLGVAPLIARPLADQVAYRLDKARDGARHYVFRWKLGQLEVSYRRAMGAGGGGES